MLIHEYKTIVFNLWIVLYSISYNLGCKLCLLLSIGTFMKGSVVRNI